MRDGLNNTLGTYVSSSAVQTCYAAHMEFASGAQKVCTSINSITLTDKDGLSTYQPVGNLGSIGSVTETTEISAKNFEVVLSGVDPNNLSMALSENFRGRDITIYQVFFNADYTAQEQITLFRGFMDGVTVTESEDTATVTVSCENRLLTLSRPQEIRYTDEAQKVLYPADKGLEYLGSMVDKEIFWGNANPANSVAAGTYAPGVDKYKYMRG